MRVVDIGQFGDTLVLHFQTDGPTINAYTLASSLVSIADAAKAANLALNPGYDIEVVVEALGSGSFRAKIRAVYSKARNLFSDQRLQAVVLSILASFIYERTLSVDKELKVTVNSNEVIVERENERLIVPRQIYDATRKAERSQRFVQAVSRTMESISGDPKIRSLGFVPELTSPPPEISIQRVDVNPIQQL